MSDHMCPYGLKSTDLLEHEGYTFDDHHLTSCEDVEAFKKEHAVETIPQTFVGGDRIGGFDALAAYLGKSRKEH